MINKTIFFIVAAIAISFISYNYGIIDIAFCEDKPKPNIMIILADDLGFSDLGCYGGEIETPQLDRLVANGLRYTNFYNSARCWPTRAALLTGYYPQQIARDSAPGIKLGNRPAWALLLPKRLKLAGYRSYHSGKWHIDGMPVANGFDRSYFLQDTDRFFSPKKHWEDDKRLSRVQRGTGFYTTEKIASKAIDYLTEHKAKHSDKPFFAYVAFTAPHFPLQAPQEDILHIGERYSPGWDKCRQRRWERMQELGIASGQLSMVEHQIGPPYHFPDALQILGTNEVNRPVPWNNLTLEQKKFQQTKMTIHAAMVERMDREVGRILMQLREMGAYDNTLIIFLSDNGASAEIMVRGDMHDTNGSPGSSSTYLCLGPGWSTASNTPFRRHKTWVHEGGICTPFIIHWPQQIYARGELRRDPSHVIDLVPTILDLVGVSNIKKAPVNFPGRSLKPTFARQNNWNRTLWWFHEGNRALLVGDWKLVSAKDEEWELFNLVKDRTESSNLVNRFPAKAAELENRWINIMDSFKTEIKDTHQR